MVDGEPGRPGCATGSCWNVLSIVEREGRSWCPAIWTNPSLTECVHHLRALSILNCVAWGKKLWSGFASILKSLLGPPHAKIISKHCISWNKAPIHCALSLIHRRRVLARWPLRGVNSFIYFRWSRDYDVSPSDPPTKGVFHLIWCVGCSNCAPHAQDFHPLANSLFCTKVMSSLFAVATSGTCQHSWTSSFCNCLVSYWRCCSPCSAFVWLFYTFLVAEKLNCI